MCKEGWQCAGANARRCPNGEGIQIVHMLKDAPELSGETRESGIEEK